MTPKVVAPTYPPSIQAMTRKNSETPAESEAGSGARSRTRSGVLSAAAAALNSLVRTLAVPGLAAVWMSRVSPLGPAMIAAFTCPPVSAAWAWCGTG